MLKKCKEHSINKPQLFNKGSKLFHAIKYEYSRGGYEFRNMECRVLCSSLCTSSKRKKSKTSAGKNKFEIVYDVQFLTDDEMRFISERELSSKPFDLPAPVHPRSVTGTY